MSPANRAPAPRGPLRVFVSYAREDAEFVDRLREALRVHDIDVWIDRREIAPAANWLQRIVQGITEATFFVFVASPDSVSSEICSVELQQAVALHKPLVPVLRRAAPLPEALRDVQWADFTKDEAFAGALADLEAALRRDPEWLALHARLAAAAASWMDRGRPWHGLLQGRAIAEAERWLAGADDERRRPTDLQRAYVLESRRFSSRWRWSAAILVSLLLCAVAVTTVYGRRGRKAGAARELATRAIQLRNNDQSALAESTLMLISASQNLSALGIRSPDVDATLRETARLLLPVRGQGRHPGGVGGLAVSSDGRRIATYAFSRTASVSGLYAGRSDTTVRVWNVPSVQPVATLTHDSLVSAAAFDGGQRLVTGSITGTLMFWNVDSVLPGQAAVATVRLEGPIVAIVSSLSRAFTATTSGAICAWDTRLGSRLWCVQERGESMVALLALSPDARYLASGRDAGGVTLRDARNGRVLSTMSHTSRGDIDALTFSPGSNQLASGDTKGELNLWSVPDGAKTFTALHRDRVTGIVYSQATGSGFIATSSTDRSLRIFDPSFSSWRTDEFRSDYSLWQVAVDPSTRFMALARGDGYVDVWSRQDERLVARIRIDSGDVATGLAFLPGELLGVVDGGEGVRFYYYAHLAESASTDTAHSVDDVAVAPSGVTLLSNVLGESSVMLLAAGHLDRAPFPPSSFSLARVAPDGQRIALVDGTSSVLRLMSLFPRGLSDTRHWRLAENIGALAWHPDGALLAVGKRDGGTWIYDTATAMAVREAASGASGMSFSAEGEWLAMVVPDEGVRLWRWHANATPDAPAQTADAVAAEFSRVGSILVTAHRDRSVKSWFVESGRGGVTLRQRWSADVCPGGKTLALSGDDSLLATGCKEDGRIRLSSAAAGATIAEMRYPGKLGAVAFSADARTLVAGGEKGVRTFIISGTDLVQEACARVPRNMNLAEWARNIGGPCSLVCPDLPGCN